MKLPDNVESALEIQGATTNHGLLLMDKFLRLAMSHDPSGLCFEFGTLYGRSTSLMASHLGNDSWLHAVEQADYLEIDRIHKVSPRVTWHKTSSEPFCNNDLKELVGTKKISCSHHDASHFFDNVKTEISSIVDHMSPHGVMILDDFNDVYPQVRSAYYYLRYAEAFPYELVLHGFNKAILVHQDMFDYYEEIILTQLQTEYEEVNEILTELVRTDVSVHSRAFFLRTRTANNPERLYGVSSFGDQFYKTSNQHKNLKVAA